MALPFLGPIVKRRNLVHIGSVLETTLAAGLPLTKALDSASKLDVNPVFQEALGRLEQKVANGARLAHALKYEAAVFPPAWRGMIAIGESSGLLAQSIRQVTNLYEQQANKRARILIEIGAPLTVCAMGALVFVVYSSLFVAVYGLSAAVSAPF